MFVIVPWRVDVPEERFPFMNWLIIVATVVVFGIQVAEFAQNELAEGSPSAVRGVPGPQGTPAPIGSVRQPSGDGEERPQEDITRSLMLQGWHLKGLFGHIWLHGSIFHLLGNMWFLWIFGNAVCAKVGNVAYPLLYVALGVAAGIAHLLGSSATAIGASGAINGIVGMYLVLFPQNDITCYWSFMLIFWRQFTVSSFWMIVFWTFWDIFGLFQTGTHVAYCAHLGGFAAGFGAALLMCQKGWITMERYEKSLLQIWQEWRRGSLPPAYEAVLTQAASPSTREPPDSDAPIPLPPPSLPHVPLLDLHDAAPRATAAAPILVQCSCGHTIQASRRYEGKIVRCPHCRESVRIPGQGEPRHPPKPSVPQEALTSDDYIRFSCRCGQTVKVPSGYAGRWGKCPQCGVRLQIPPSP